MKKLWMVNGYFFALFVLVNCSSPPAVVVTTVVDEVSPETTSMLYLDYDFDIIEFDRTSVQWLGEPTNNKRTGIIIPSGSHSLIGEKKNNDAVYPLIYEFEPKQFYYLRIREGMLNAYAQSGNFYAKSEMERIIENTYRLQTIQGSNEYSIHLVQPVQNQGIHNAVRKAAQTIIASLKDDENIAIINISSSDTEMAEFVAGELEVILVNNRLIVVDRSTLDNIRQEQNFQLSGDVDDNSAVSIGKFVGARIVIVGSISGSGEMRRLRFRALNTQSAQIVGASSEAF